MKQVKFFIAIALFVSVFAVSCKETPKEEVAPVEEVVVEEAAPVVEEVAVDTTVVTVEEVQE